MTRQAAPNRVAATPVAPASCRPRPRSASACAIERCPEKGGEPLHRDHVARPQWTRVQNKVYRGVSALHPSRFCGRWLAAVYPGWPIGVMAPPQTAHQRQRTRGRAGISSVEGIDDRVLVTKLLILARAPNDDLLFARNRVKVSDWR